MNRSITLVFVFVFLTASFISMADAQTSIATNAFIGLQPAIATISQQAKSPTVILSVPNPSPAPEPTAAPPADTGDFWTQKASMHVARSNLGVTVANGKIYAIGGNTENGYVPNSAGNNYKTLGWISGANEEYDPIIDTWTLRKPMPTPRV
ncbi:MAG TPA: kelch repeat-containing protein, partial [Candidatus Bathyarchaeia archaeon]|nr:kelch repeat-containing protein [Candidatus Bathyarchaeia archaeon]